MLECIDRILIKEHVIYLSYYSHFAVSVEVVCSGEIVLLKALVI